MKSRRKAPEDCLIQPRHDWKRAEVNLIKRELPGKTYAQVAEMIAQRFGWDCQYYHVKKYCKSHGIKCGYRKGWGKLGEERLFPKNDKNHKPVRMWYVKVGKGVPGADKYGWKLKQHILAEKILGGPIPKGYKVIFNDGNPENCAPENLMIVTRSQASTRAQLLKHHGIRSYDRESSEVLNTLADLVYAAGRTPKRRRKQMAKRKKEGPTIDEAIAWARDTEGEPEANAVWYARIAGWLEELKAHRSAWDETITEIEGLDHDHLTYGYGIYTDIIRKHRPAEA